VTSDLTGRRAWLGWDAPSERLIAFVRLALAGGALAVVTIDPTQPSRHVPVAYTAFLSYLAYSAVVFQLARRAPRPWLPLFTQVVDLLWVAPVLYFTEGANTPFFPFFVIFTLTAGIRWGMWAAWAVTAYSLVVYTTLLLVATPHPLDLNNDLMQLGYFLVVGVLGGYLAEYRRRHENERRVLRTISEAVAGTPSAVAALGALVSAAGQWKLADTVIGVLRHPESGEVLMVRGSAEIRPLSPEESSPFFAVLDAGPRLAGPGTGRLLPADAVLLQFIEADEGLACPIRAGGDVVGGLYLLARLSGPDRRRSRVQGPFLDLLLRQVVPQVETLYLLERASETRVADERRRIARDLHDSFIQVLAALGLRLRAVGDLLSTDPSAATTAGKEVVDLHEVVCDELRRVRAYLAEMREPLPQAEGLRAVVEEIVQGFRSRTHLHVALAVDIPAAMTRVEVARELLPILREALTNVEKHAGASQASVTLRAEADALLLTVTDDGIGIGHEGSGAARTAGHGLGSMRERVALLGGTLRVASGPEGGTIVSVSVPSRRV
jgi:signal transduction histidine kinase